ncbi:MAG TPA: L-threonylcarbamoyladenylate synthase [Arthrobacter sp.]|nr:L-threonylcarbamoyladenylate synthase [Arthrobacter sp.]
MTERFDCTTEPARSEGLAAAQEAVAAQQCIVLPTDTVYGIGADAFSPQAVATLLAAKGRGRNMPPPVLIPRVGTMDGLAMDIPEDARLLANFFWPGPLTLILRSQPSLTWDLGETRGTVALRIPDDDLARDLLDATGPLAVSSANRSGMPAATTAAEAEAMLAESVAVYLDGGPRPLPVPEAAEAADATGDPAVVPALPSTIVDCTGDVLRVVRQGALPLADLREHVPSLLGFGEEAPDAAAADQPAADTDEPDFDADAGAAADKDPLHSGVELKEDQDAAATGAGEPDGTGRAPADDRPPASA